jgi:mannose-6-phosphate isomerase-like protein (cupin superfamily)
MWDRHYSGSIVMPSLEHELAEARASGRAYFEFMRSLRMSVGVYVLPVGGVDRQSPHTEDEIYYVVRGRGRIRFGDGSDIEVEDEDQEVKPGDLLFMLAGMPHHFHSITEELVLLVVFAPPEKNG